MKLFKSSILALSALTAVAFTACSDDDPYQPAAPSAGLYFLESAAATQELPADENSFVVSVSRTGLTDAASYGINVTATAEDASIFTLPTQAVFAEGAETGTITFGYDGSKLVSGTDYEFTITLADNTPACAFGVGNVTFKAILQPNYGPWEKFDKEGEGTYSYCFVFQTLLEVDEDPGLPVSIRQSKDDPNMSQVRVEHWGVDQDFFINYNTATGICTVPIQGTGQMINLGASGVFELMFADVYTYAKSFGYTNAEEFAEASYYDKDAGRFTLFMAYGIVENGRFVTLSLGGEETIGYEYLQMNGYKDYTVTLDYKGVYTDADEVSTAIVNVTVSPDATRAKMLLRRNAASPQAVLDELKNGAEDAVDVKAGVTDQMFQLPLVGPGNYTLVAASYEGAEVAFATYTQFQIAGVQEDPNTGFHRVGLAEICDAWITAAYGFTKGDGTPMTYEDLIWSVELLESDDTPGLYRLVNPWLSPDAIVNYPFSDGTINLNTKPTSVSIDATNDKCVVIAPQYSGCTIDLRGNDTPMWISNGDGYFLTPEFAELAELPAVLTKQDLIDRGLATPFNGGDISIPDAVYGFSEEEFGYQLNLGTQQDPVHPEGYILFRFDDQKVSPRRVARQMDIRMNSRANFAAKRVINNAFSYKKEKTFTKSNRTSVKLNKGIIRL